MQGLFSVYPELSPMYFFSKGAVYFVSSPESHMPKINYLA